MQEQLEALRGLSGPQLVRPSGVISAPLPSPLSLATSGEVGLRLPRSSEELQPLDADDDDADTEQVGLESLRPPAPAAGTRVPGKGLAHATVRVALPGLVPTPAADRLAAAPPARDPAPLTSGRPEPEPPVPQELAEEITGQALSEPEADPDGAAADLELEPVTGSVPVPDSRPISDPTNRLPLPAQSTLILGSAAQMPTLNLPAFSADELKEAVGRGGPKSSPAATGNAATVLSGRSHAATLPAGVAETLPLGSFARYLPRPESRQQTNLERLQGFLRTQTPLGSVGRVLLLCALLGLLVVVLVGIAFK
ncbi:MAG TPA: hypothetical protein PLW65_34010 [Pseudomonadota bacterium]|nr:hypothetical protein [Pseudomonadota bacterium]